MDRLVPFGGITTRVIRTLNEIEEIRLAWESWSNHPNSDVDFFLTNLQNESGNPRPHIIVVYRHGEPRCMLVGRIATRAIELKIGYKTLFRPEARVLGFVYSGLLGNIDAPGSHAIVHEISKSLARKEADVAFLNFLSTNGLLYESLRQVPSRIVQDYFPKEQMHRGLTAAKSAADFMRNLTTNERSNHKRRSKRVLEDFGASTEVICFKKSIELNTLLSDAEYIAARGYQRAMGVGFANTGHLRSLLKFEADRERLRGYILYVAGKPWAFHIGTLYNRTFYSDYIGYDPEYSKYAPGNLLSIEMFKTLCESGEVDRIDFGLGDAEWKRILGDHGWHEASCFLFGHTARGLWLNGVRTPIMFADQGLRLILKKTSWLPRIKTGWRRQLVRSEVRSSNASSSKSAP